MTDKIQKVSPFLLSEDLLNNTQSFLQKTKLDHHKITETVKKDTRLIISAFEGMSNARPSEGWSLTQPHSGEKLNGPLHDGYNDLDPTDTLVKKSLKKTHTELSRTHKQNEESIDYLQQINGRIDVFLTKIVQLKKKLNDNILKEKFHQKLSRSIKNSRIPYHLTEEQEEVIKYSLLQTGGRRRRRSRTKRLIHRGSHYSNKTRK